MKTLIAMVATIGVATVLSVSLFANPVAKKDLVDTAIDSKQFPTLVSLVKQAGLVDVLKSDGPFTVFAPTEEAFRAVPKETLNKLAGDKELLKKVLLYHVVPANVKAKDVVKLSGKSAETALKGQKVTVKVDSKGVVMINTAKVIKTDIGASNGTIHVINKVLIPDLSEPEASASACSSCVGK